MTQQTQTSLEGNILPTSIAQVGIIARYEILNYFRSRRFFILLAITLLISGLLTFAIAYEGDSIAGSPPQALPFYATYWGFASNLIVVFCAVFFGGDAISGEFQNKTGYFLVGNPIRRSSIYVGKWIAALTASLIMMGVFTVICLGNGFYWIGTSIPTQFVEAISFTLIYLVAALGFTFFFSSLFKSSSFSILVTVVLLLFGFSLIDTVVTNLIHVEPWFTLSYGSGIISNVFTIPYPQHITTVSFGGGGRGPTLTEYIPTIPEGLIIMVIYFALTAILGLLLFERKEFN
ncbi:MAG: ABC transporter permease [Thaumarchaeota archaeon]|nr:ABC transporter permease [Nitrososphaerota archaeon]